MKNPRLYVPESLSSGEELALPVEAANHLKVLRLRPGAPLTLFNGEGGEYEAELLALERREVRVRVGEHRAHEVESPLEITLLQGISKGERMDFTIQKAVELGVTRILPVFTERSVVQLRDDRLEKRHRHWIGVIESACEQCGRNRLPELLEARPLADAWPAVGEGLHLVLAPEASTGLRDLSLSRRISLLIGPEGGLSAVEVDQALSQGFTGLRLGPRILRTETAGLAALAALQVAAGDLG